MADTDERLAASEREKQWQAEERARLAEERDFLLDRVRQLEHQYELHRTRILRFAKKINKRKEEREAEEMKRRKK